MTRRSSVAVLAALAAIATAAGYAAYLKPPQAAQLPAPTISAAGLAQLHATALPDPTGKMQAFSAWKGKVLVVNFWATWCPPCRDEMPTFSRLQNKFSRKGVQFVGIGIDSPSAIKEFQAQSPVSYPLLIGGSEGLELTRALGNASGALPYTVVLGRDGHAVFARLGVIDESTLEALLGPLTGG